MYRQDRTRMSREEIQEMMAKMPKPVSKYTEGSLVGYRWYDTKNVKPMYAFGHGLSYVSATASPMLTSSTAPSRLPPRRTS